MKKIFIITSLVVSLLFFSSGSVQAMKDIVISESNEYGGKTVEITFEKGEKEYDIYKKVTTYHDSKKILRKLESFYIDKIAKGKGVYLAIRYFDPNGKKIKDEEFTTEEEIERTDFEKSVTYYDSNEIKTKTENFPPDRLVKKTGIVKTITYYKGGKLDNTNVETIYSVEYAKEKGYNRSKASVDIKKGIITYQYFMDDKLIKTEEIKM